MPGGGERWVRLSTEAASSTICVLDTELSLDVCGSAPRAARAFDVWATPGLTFQVTHKNKEWSLPFCARQWPLDPTAKVTVTMEAPSKEVNEEKIRISYYQEKGKMPIAKAILHLTCIEISLDADIHRSGTVTRREKEKSDWSWGPEGKGAILLVNCDRDEPGAGKEDHKDTRLTSFEDREDMSLMILSTHGPQEVFETHQLLLHISAFENDKVRVFCCQGQRGSRRYEHVLGSGKLTHEVQRLRGQVESVFYVEGLKFPDANFPGLVYLHASLLEATCEEVPLAPIFTDSLVFRVAPWIMTPNTLQPLSVYVCSVVGNDGFVAEMKKLTKKVGCQLIICPKEENDGDQWIQDEMELGYTQAPHKSFPVVYDSPRDRGLKDYPWKLLGPDFGYIRQDPPKEEASTHDGFGNLEVSPPVTVRGKEYPLGRILIGNYFPGSKVKLMVKATLDFLYAQKVQPPIELHSDWLAVGHIDEFLSFIPAPDKKGFRLLLASPRACFKLLMEKEQEGHGEAQMFEGLKRLPLSEPREGRPEVVEVEEKSPRSITEILADKSLRNWNEFSQKCIDWNRAVLKRELELTEEDIIDIPQLFTESQCDNPENCSAVAYFPNMVNMVVLGKYLGIPKPFGPIIREQCCVEEEVRRLLEPLGLACVFIDDYRTYHNLRGDVHCGTNVRRKPFPFKWWNIIL